MEVPSGWQPVAAGPSPEPAGAAENAAAAAISSIPKGLGDLPAEALRGVARRLSASDVAALATTAKRYAEAMRPLLRELLVEALSRSLTEAAAFAGRAAVSDERLGHATSADEAAAALSSFFQKHIVGPAIEIDRSRPSASEVLAADTKQAALKLLTDPRGALRAQLVPLLRDMGAYYRALSADGPNASLLKLVLLQVSLRARARAVRHAPGPSVKFW